MIPFVVLGLGMGLLSIWWERYHQGTRGEFFALGLPERILLASHALWFYAGKLLWPANLVFSYPRWTISASSPFDYFWLAMTAGFIAVVYFTRSRIGRSVEVAALFFAATLSPMLGFIMVFTFRYSFVADHYQYLACLGPLTLAAAGLTKAFARLEKRGTLLQSIVCCALLFTLAALTWRQCAMYRDWDTIWRTTLAKNPRSWMAHNNLAHSLERAGRLNEAVAHYQIALKLKPGFEYNYNLASPLLKLGRVDEAIAHYERALKLNPKYAEASNNLGCALWQKGKIAEAIPYFRRAIAINPAYFEAHYNLGDALLRVQQSDEALIEFRKAVELDPADAQAQRKLGNTLLATGQFDEGLACLEKARKIESRQQGDQ